MKFITFVTTTNPTKAGPPPPSLMDAIKNPLDEIDGIGPTRKRALLNHFGSAKAVGRASLQDIASIPGISDQMAQMIYDHFNRAG